MGECKVNQLVLGTLKSHWFMEWKTQFCNSLSLRDSQTSPLSEIIDTYQILLKTTRKQDQHDIKALKLQKENMIHSMLSLTDYLNVLGQETNESELRDLVDEKSHLLLKLEMLIVGRDSKVDTYLQEILKRDELIENLDLKKRQEIDLTAQLTLENDELNFKLNLLQEQLEKLENTYLPVYAYHDFEYDVNIRKVKIKEEGSLFCCFTRNDLYVYDLETCKLYAKAAIKDVISCSFSFDFLVVVKKNDISIYSVLDLEKTIYFVQDEDELFMGAFVNEELFISGHMKHIKLWDVKSGFDCTRVIRIVDPCLDFTKYNNFVITAHVNDLYIWDFNFDLVRVVNTKQFITSVTANEDVVLISHQSSLEIYDLFKDQSTLVKSPEFECGCLWNNSVISASGAIFATGTVYGTVLFYHFEDQFKPQKILRVSEKPITCVDWSRNGKFLIVSSLDRHVRVFKNI